MIKHNIILLNFHSYITLFCGKICVYTRNISNCHAESNGHKPVTKIIDAYSYTVSVYFPMLDWLYNEYTAETYTKKSLAPKVTMGRIHKMLSEDKTQ